MKEYYVWTDQYDYINIEKLEVVQSMNAHGRAYVKGIIHEKDKERYMQSLAKEQWVKILVKDEDGNMAVLFCGMVLQAELEEGGINTGLTLELVTGTFLLDKEEHYRVIQKEHYQLEEVIKEIGRCYEDYRYDMNEQPGNIKGIRVQYQETDWQFLKRLLGEAGYCIIPDCQRKGIRFGINVSNDGSTNIEEEDFSLLISGDKRKYTVKSRKLHRLGEKAIYRKQVLYIYKIVTKYLNAECVHEYQLMPKPDVRIPKVANQSVVGCSLPAIVTAVEADKVQVKFPNNMTGEESDLGKIQTWFGYSTVYSTPTGAGWYCMPEPGDTVRVYFPSDQEKDAYAISAVHLGNGSQRQNPERKSIKNIYGKEILLTPHSLVMTNNKGMTVKLEDEEGILIESNKDINIMAQGNMVISSAKASVMIAGTESVALNQGGTGITIDQDILFNGSEFRIQ